MHRNALKLCKACCEQMKMIYMFLCDSKRMGQSTSELNESFKFKRQQKPPHMQTKPHVTGNFMCQFDWATGPRQFWPNTFLDVPVKVLFFQTRLTFKYVDFE